MAVPFTNMRFTRIETEINEAIQAHPDIHDELIRYSWNMDQEEYGDYYEGLAHSSLCRTAIQYKGFLGLGEGNDHATHGGYSIKEFQGYDWENHGTSLANQSTQSSTDVSVSVDVDNLILTFDSDDSSAFYVKSQGIYGIGPVRAGTDILTTFTTASAGSNHSHVVNFEVDNFAYRHQSSTNSGGDALFFVRITNGEYIDSVKARWRLKDYHAIMDDNSCVALASIERDSANPAGFEYARNDTIAERFTRTGDQDEFTGTLHPVTPAVLGGSDLSSTYWSDTNSFLSALHVYSNSISSSYKRARLNLQNGGYYAFELRFYHSAATRDYTQLSLRAARTSSSSGDAIMKLMQARSRDE